MRATAFLLIATVCACGNSSSGIDVQALTDSFETSHLPLVLFDTGGVPIPNEPKIPARMIVIDNDGDNSRDSLLLHFDGNIGIELRGHSSLAFPKRQFGVETRDEFDDGLDVALLGLPEEEDWVFYAPYSDKTLLRNWFVYGLAGELGGYAPRTRFVEVFVNGLYWGVYVFTEKIKRDKNRIDIQKLKSDDNAEPDVTGGYLLEMTDIKTPGDTFVRTNRALLEVKEPKSSKVTAAQLDWINAYMQAFEDALYGPDFEDENIGWRAFADEDSFIDYMLIQELVRNLDGFRRSTFLQKDRGGLLRAGPVWDFNLAMGNLPNDDEDFPTEGFLLRRGSTWAVRMLSDRAFAERLIARWRELRQGVFATDRMLARIDSGVLRLGDAADRNFARWPVIGKIVSFNPTPPPQSYAEEIEALKAWLTARAQWLDDFIHTIG